MGLANQSNTRNKNLKPITNKELNDGKTNDTIPSTSTENDSTLLGQCFIQTNDSTLWLFPQFFIYTKVSYFFSSHDSCRVNQSQSLEPSLPLLSLVLLH